MASRGNTRQARPQGRVLLQWVKDRGESEGRAVTARIGDATIAPTRKGADFHVVASRERGLHQPPDGDDVSFGVRLILRDQGGRSSMAELKLPKLKTRVRFPSPAPSQRRLIWTQAIAMSPPPTGDTGTGFRGRTSSGRSVGCRQGSRKPQRQVNGARCAACNDSSPSPRARKRSQFGG